MKKGKRVMAPDSTTDSAAKMAEQTIGIAVAQYREALVARTEMSAGFYRASELVDHLASQIRVLLKKEGIDMQVLQKLAECNVDDGLPF